MTEYRSAGNRYASIKVGAATDREGTNEFCLGELLPAVNAGRYAAISSQGAGKRSVAAQQSGNVRIIYIRTMYPAQVD